jgi:hypothetical protein
MSSYDGSGHGRLKGLNDELGQVHDGYASALSNVTDPLTGSTPGRRNTGNGAAGAGAAGSAGNPHTSLAAYRAEAEQARVVDTLKTQLQAKSSASANLQEQLSTQKSQEQQLRNRLVLEENSRKQLVLDLENAKARVTTLRAKVADKSRQVRAFVGLRVCQRVCAYRCMCFHRRQWQTD